MKSSIAEAENSCFFHPEDRNGCPGSISESLLDVDTKKELPKEFANYLRSLFDILDQDHCGYIKLTDIENYWDVKGPSFSAMIDYLRQCSPDNGLINFDTLCTGLKFVVHTPNITSHSIQKDHDWTSDSSEDSFRLHDFETKEQLLRKLQPKLVPEEPKDTSLMVNATKTTLASNQTGSTSKVYFVAKELSSSTAQHEQDGLRGGGTNTVLARERIDMKIRSNQVEEELQVLKEGLNVIEKARKWYFKRFTAVQEENLLLQQSDKNSLEQFQYEMLLHKTRRKELNLNETVFKCYKKNIQELNKYMKELIENPHELLNISNSMDECSSTREQLQQLNHDLLEKNSRIAQLEKEKSVLIRDLFQAKAAAGLGNVNK
ncbi:uncharacterized protein LOC116300694 [Actinia tenebrosa]|uniref:Uncharacterized protein LOC116300694 n=1 Tax=Actinia tenebrosa TaxID=6105 RepID=A0A6P8IFF0_ACTTE|nr:uncharacterized protein LOC116300694 [Actinia tenebrosa]